VSIKKVSEWASYFHSDSRSRSLTLFCLNIFSYRQFTRLPFPACGFRASLANSIRSSAWLRKNNRGGNRCPASPSPFPEVSEIRVVCDLNGIPLRYFYGSSVVKTPEFCGVQICPTFLHESRLHENIAGFSSKIAQTGRFPNPARAKKCAFATDRLPHRRMTK
jgi:hypothetical protein